MSAVADPPVLTTEQAATRDAAGGVAAWGYRPYLDGMRAIAVYLVVMFHAGADRFDAGFIGVDVFFVLSGYLVTQLLLRDIRGDGRIGYRRFYSRRFRRLLPAAVVVLIVTAAVFPVVAAPAELVDAKGALRAASMYYANWFFIAKSSDYFAADIQSNPVVHFWSLSVEEQFYAAWPVLLGGLFWVTRRLRERAFAAVRILVAVGLLLSLGAAIHLSGTNLSRAYYGTDTRVYQLLAGALLAMSPGLIESARKSRWLQQLLPVVAGGALVVLVLLGSSLLDVDAINRGALVTILTVTLIASLEATKGGVTRGALSWPLLVYLGRISYGIYLWHWLVIVVTERTVSLSPLSTAIVAAVLASGLASLSYQVLERPVRESAWLDQRRRRVIAIGLATSVLTGIVIAPAVLERGNAGADVVVAGGTSVTGLTPIPPDLDWRGAAVDHGAFPNCTAAAPDKCVLVPGPGKRILLVGDSNARMYIPMLTELAKKNHMSLAAAVAGGCPWQDGILRRGQAQIGNKIQDLGPPCIAHHADWYGTDIAALHPDIVVVANQPWDDPNGEHPIQDVDTGSLETDSRAFLSSVRSRSEESIAKLRAGGAKVVILEPMPISTDKQDPLKCLSEATYFEECRFVSHTKPLPVEEVYRVIAADDPTNVISVDLDRNVCPYLPICDPVVDSLIVRWDPEHLTVRFADTLTPAFEKVLTDRGFL